MGVEHRIRLNRMTQITQSVAALKGKAAEVGIFGGEQGWLAQIHGYGCSIPVTPKMRKYLASTGLHLKATTTVITIPERAFLRNGYEKSKEETMALISDLINAMVDGGLDGTTLLEALGTNLEGKIKEYATSQVEPGLHPYTIEHRKNGGTNPLNDTGSMIGAISHRIV